MTSVLSIAESSSHFSILSSQQYLTVDYLVFFESLLFPSYILAGPSQSPILVCVLLDFPVVLGYLL